MTKFYDFWSTVVKQIWNFVKIWSNLVKKIQKSDFLAKKRRLRLLWAKYHNNFQDFIFFSFLFQLFWNWFLMFLDWFGKAARLFRLIILLTLHRMPIMFCQFRYNRYTNKIGHEILDILYLWLRMETAMRSSITRSNWPHL